MKYRFLRILLAILASLGAATARAQTGTTLTPDRLNFMVNKDVGTERWTINVNLFSNDLGDISNITGNVFKSDGSPPSFILCQVRPDSTGTFADPTSELRLRCRGTGPCDSTARRCSRNDWGPIPGADDIRLPVSFFLPPGGLGAAAAGPAPSVRAAAAEAPAQSADRGATLSFDALNLLVNKDVGGERWSISLNFLPEVGDDGGLERKLTSVTGNVIRQGGAPPAFLYCTQRTDSTGTLLDPASEFRLSCQAMDACQTTAEECASSSWQTIADDVALPASFFLPPDGLIGGTQSDPELIIIGRTSGPPAIVTEDFDLGTGSAARASAGGPLGEGLCPVGEPCSVPRVGSCATLNGEVVEIEGRCGCQLENIAGSCLFCASGSCGEACEFPVGDRTARGMCMPYLSDTSACVCYPIEAGAEAPAVAACGGPLGAGCAPGSCCADDPGDGCDPAFDFHCAGICVTSECPGGGDVCGICQLIGASCGNGDRDPGEQCDGDDFGAFDCTDFGFFAGELACDDECRVDTSGCDGPTVTPAPCKTGTCE